jgi:hypothetical protein
MGSRILNIIACWFVAVWPIAVHGQGPNAQTVTQSILDQHKSADPTNSARALTGKNQEFDISKIPPPSVRSPKATRSSPKTSQHIRELEKKKQQFFKNVKRQSADTTFVPASRGTSAAPDYDTRVLPAGTMSSAGSPASMGQSSAAFNAIGGPPAGTMKPAASPASMERSRAAFNTTKAKRDVNQEWENSKDGRTLRRLKAEVAEASKARRKTEFDISDVPLPRSSPR